LFNVTPIPIFPCFFLYFPLLLRLNVTASTFVLAVISLYAHLDDLNDLDDWETERFPALVLLTIFLKNDRTLPLHKDIPHLLDFCLMERPLRPTWLCTCQGCTNSNGITIMSIICPRVLWPVTIGLRYPGAICQYKNHSPRRASTTPDSSYVRPSRVGGDPLDDRSLVPPCYNKRGK
jgi:hypothetical protein